MDDNYSKEEIQEIVNLNKEIMESIAKVSSKYTGDKGFQIASESIAAVICSVLKSFGISKYHGKYIKNIHESVIAHISGGSEFSVMEFKNGEKVSEGKIN